MNRNRNLAGVCAAELTLIGILAVCFPALAAVRTAPSLHPSGYSPALSTLAVSASSKTGGLGVTGTVTFTVPLTASASVALSSSNAAASVPPTVSAEAGATSAIFAITTKAVAANTPVTIKATYGGTSKTVVLTVIPAVLSSVTLNPANPTGGKYVSISVVFTGNLAVGAAVSLSSTNSAAVVPASVSVPAGSSSAAVGFWTSAVSAVKSGAVTAAHGGISKSAALTVVPPTIATYTVTPNSVVGGQNVTGLVSMTGPLAVATTVSLSSENVKAILPSATVTIPAGSSSVSFTIRTTSTTSLVSNVVRAAVGGLSKSALLSVKPSPLSIK